MKYNCQKTKIPLRASGLKAIGRGHFGNLITKMSPQSPIRPWNGGGFRLSFLPPLCRSRRRRGRRGARRHRAAVAVPPPSEPPRATAGKPQDAKPPDFSGEVRTLSPKLVLPCFRGMRRRRGRFPPARTAGEDLTPFDHGRLGRPASVSPP